MSLLSQIRKLAEEYGPEAVEEFQGLLARFGGEPIANNPNSMPNIPGLGRVQIGTNPQAIEAAERYAEQSGVPYSPLMEYASVDVPRAQRIAREYELMPHAPQDPEVARAYDAMIDETLGQYDQMLTAGVKPYFIREQDPYQASPYLSLIDLIENNRLGVFPTRSGFGTSEEFDPALNPLLRETEFMLDGEPMLANDVFRAVHDYFGHAKPGVGFRARGEENAYQSHAGMYSPLARRALASETRGQNSWLNYGPFGESNRTAGIDDTVFADQKTGLMPRWASESGRLTATDRRERFFRDLSAGRTGLEGAIDDSGNLRLVHYSRQPLERVDPAFYGQGLSGRTVAERNRAQEPDFIPRSYYGIEASERPYRRESGLGNVRNEVVIDAELMYPVQKDPEKLWKGETVSSKEKAIADEGYSGYYMDHPQLGKVGVVFDPLDTAKKYVIPIAALGQMGAAMQFGESKEDAI